MRHAFSIREGLNRREFELPAKIPGRPPYKEGPLPGKTFDIDVLINDYYTAMEWNTKTAKRSRNKLQGSDWMT